MGDTLTLREVRALAEANYSRGGDWVLEMLTDADIRRLFCVPGGRRVLYEYMQAVVDMRNYIESTCMA